MTIGSVSPGWGLVLTSLLWVAVGVARDVLRDRAERRRRAEASAVERLYPRMGARHDS